jgi:hypothetical protein
MIPGWKEEIEGEYLEFLRKPRKLTPADFASRFDVSECCAVYWLTELARKGKVRITSVEFLEEGETPCGLLNSLSCRRKPFCPVPQVAKAIDTINASHAEDAH